MADSDDLSERRNGADKSNFSFAHQSCFPSSSYVPKRFVLALVLFTSVWLIMIIRICISVTVTGDNGMGAEYGWTNTEKGFVLSAFYWGYICPQILGGYLAVKYGARQIFGTTIFIAVIFSTLTPAASLNYGLLIACRVTVGFFEGFVMPNIDQLISRWMPPRERSRALSFLAGASYFGSGFSFLVTPAIMSITGWQGVFYVYGVAGFLWFLTWIRWGYNSPQQHPFISEVERDYILEMLRLANFEEKSDRVVPWKALFTATPVLAPCIAHFCFNWAYYTLLSFLPEFFNSVLGYSLTTGGAFQVLPYVFMFLMAQLSAQIVEFLTGARSGRAFLSLGTVRKMLAGFGYLCPAILLISIGYVTESGVAVAMMTIAVAFTGLNASAYNSSFNDVAPHFAGVVQGVSNTLATVPGIVSPILCGLLLDNGGCDKDLKGNQPDSCVSAWRTIFFISAAVFFFGFSVYALFAKAVMVVDDKGNRVDLIREKEGYELF